MEPKPKRIPSDVRNVAVRFSNHLGLKPHELSRKVKNDTGLSYKRRAYRALLRKYKVHRTTKDLPRSGRPTKLSVGHFNFIDKAMLENDELTERDLAKKLKDEFGITFSQKGIGRIRRKLGWKLTGTKYCQLISNKNQECRLKWCLDMMKSIRNGDKLENVIFTDESSFQLNSYRNFHLTNKKLNHKGRKPTPKHPFKVHVWGGISKRGATNLAIFRGIMKADFFADVLMKDFAKPFIDSAYGDQHRFQMDNDPKHTSRYAKQKMDEMGIKWFKTPASSPDLNPIEFLWGVMKRKISAQYKPTNKDQLVTALTTVWAEITPEQCSKYIDHILKIIPVIIARDGKASGY